MSNIRGDSDHSRTDSNNSSSCVSFSDQNDKVVLVNLRGKTRKKKSRPLSDIDNEKVFVLASPKDPRSHGNKELLSDSQRDLVARLRESIEEKRKNDSILSSFRAPKFSSFYKKKSATQRQDMSERRCNSEPLLNKKEEKKYKRLTLPMENKEEKVHINTIMKNTRRRSSMPTEKVTGKNSADKSVRFTKNKPTKDLSAKNKNGRRESVPPKKKVMMLPVKKVRNQ